MACSSSGGSNLDGNAPPTDASGGVLVDGGGAGAGGAGAGGQAGQGGQSGQGGKPGADAAVIVDATADAGGSPHPDSGNAVDVAAGERPTADPCASTGQCTTLETEYRDAIAKDQVCTTGANNQCQQNVSSALACGGCTAWVNTKTTTDAVRKRWQDAGCNTCLRICPAIACVAPGTGTCQLPVGGAPGAPGKCISVYPTPK